MNDADEKFDTPENRRRVRGYCRLHHREYDTSTQLAEACGNDLELYLDDDSATLPEFVFEIALEYKEDD